MIDILRPVLNPGPGSPTRRGPVPRRASDRWLAPIGIGMAAMALRALLDPWLGVQMVYVLAFPAVLIAAGRGGLVPGMVTTATCIVWSLVPMLPPTGAGSFPMQLAAAALFGLAALVVCILTQRLHSARALAVERADAAERVAMLQQRLEAALGAAPLTAFDMDRELRYRWIHSPMSWLDASAVGKRAEDLMDPETAAPLTALRRRVLETGKRANHVLTLLVDGRRTTLKIFMAPLRDEHGRIVGVTNVALDVSDRIEVAELLSRSEERFRIAQELSVDGFSVLKAVRDGGEIVDFEWEYVNPAAERIFGRRSGELVGRRLLEAMPASRSHPALFPRYVRAVETGDADVAEFEYDQDGMKGHFRNVVVRLGDGIALTVEDISDRKRAEAERLDLLQRAQTARRQAEEANQVKDEFLLTLSHELRTPLNAIVGWAHLLELRNRAPELVQGIEVIQRNARLQAKLIDDLLDVSRIMSGKLSLERRPLDLEQVLAGAVEAVRPAADAKGIALTLELADPAHTICADAARLEQVFWNVLVNGVKFTPEGGRVGVASRRDGEFVVVTVADTGEGVEPSFRPFVFDRFRQADGSMSRRHGGLGIGLSLAKHLTDMHGGSIALHSDGPGLGTTVEIRLPIAGPQAALDGDVGAGSGAVAARRLAGVRVLMVEDDCDSRVVLGEILRDAGAACETVGSGRDALALLAEDDFDCLILDLGLPDVDGHRLLLQVRDVLEARDAPMPPAVALTAFARAADRQRALDVGFAEFIEKPSVPDRVIDVVHRLSRRRGEPVPEPRQPDPVQQPDSMQQPGQPAPSQQPEQPSRTDRAHPPA